MEEPNSRFFNAKIMAFAIFWLGIGLGWASDQLFETGSLISLVLMFLGVAAGMVILYRALRY
jgi:F0F1-type ATP synthase assembly protein I